MKKFLNTTVLLAMLTACTTMMAQQRQEEYLGLPGDNLNLYAVMKLFQESETLEGFERNLNEENSRINNLDLNQDNFTDYIKVVDYVDKDVHNIVLQVAINKFENQDVAVFTVQRFSNGQVRIQLTGDEDLYGKNYFIEPYFDEQLARETPNPGYTGDSYDNAAIVRTTYYEVGAWPVIRFIYTPGYFVWHSPWTWGYWPSYWHAWRPYYWHYYYGYHYNNYHNYYSHYHRGNSPHYAHWNDFYYSHRRSYSPYVSDRIKSGHYKDTYSRPDQRRQGEALYARTNTDNNNRRTALNSDNSPERRADNTTNQTRKPAENSISTTRRTTSAATKPAGNSGTGHNTGTARRTATPDNNRIAAKPATEINTNSARKSTAPVNDRSAAKSKPEYNSFSERRSATTMSDRSTSDPKPAQSTAKSRARQETSPDSFSSRKSTAKGQTASMPARRSSGQNQAAKTTQSSEKKKTAESKKSSRR